MNAVHISDRLAEAVRFAAFCQEQRVHPRDAAQLVTLARRAFKAGERECNVTDCPADKHLERFAAYAKALRFGVRWDGLWPTLTRRGKDIYLPNVGE